MHSLDATFDEFDDAEHFPSWTFRADIPSGTSNLTLFPRFFTASKGLEPPNSLGDISQGADVLLANGLILGNVTEFTVTYRDAGDILYLNMADVSQRSCHTALS